MNIQNVNHKMIVVPTSLEDLKKFDDIKEDVIIIDFVDGNELSAFIGKMSELVKKGKEVIIIYFGGIINTIKESIEAFGIQIVNLNC